MPLTAAGLVRADLIARMSGLQIARHPVPDEDPVKRTEPNMETSLGKRPTQLRVRQVGLVSQLPSDVLAVLLDPAGVTSAARFPGAPAAARPPRDNERTGRSAVAERGSRSRAKLRGSYH